MSDPIFLRSLISNTVYAEQINSAQIQGQQAAKERANHALHETLRQEATKVKALEDSAEIGVREEHQKERQTHQEGEAQDDQGSPASDEAEEKEIIASDAYHSIDVTI